MNIYPIRVTFIPKRRPVVNNATSRLRASYLIDHLMKVFPNKYKANLDDPENADIVVINQSINEEYFTRVKHEKKRRKIFVIYDVVGRQYDSARETFDQVVEQADLITVANKIQLDRIKQLQLGKPCCILPDGIDYYEQLDTTYVPFNGNVVWFGNHQLGNLDSSMWALNYITKDNQYTASVIGKKKDIHISEVQLIEWKYEGFIQCLKSFGLCFLSHDESERQKSNNRLLVTIANGIPTIVGHSPAYAKLLRKFNLEYAIVHNESELQKALLILSDENQRRNYLSQIQPYILKNYNYNKIAKRFDKIIMEHY